MIRVNQLHSTCPRRSGNTERVWGVTGTIVLFSEITDRRGLSLSRAPDETNQPPPTVANVNNITLYIMICNFVYLFLFQSCSGDFGFAYAAFASAFVVLQTLLQQRETGVKVGCLKLHQKIAPAMASKDTLTPLVILGVICG